MANNENLKRYGKEKPSPTSEEARKSGQLGGLASGESRRKSKEMKVILDYLMDKEIKKKDGSGKASTREAVCTALVREALDGNVKAFEVIRDTLGQKPEDTHILKGGNGLSVTVEDEEHRKMLEEL